MRRTPDFSDAIASLDWADRQTDVLAAEIAAFTEANPYTITTERDANGATLVYMTNSKPVTKLFAASVNAVIQAQRNSLDYMAVALAEANGAVDPTDTYFPITKTEEGLRDKRTLKKIRALDPADQQRILDLKPYGGGNDTLYALHELNRERKHRRLGVVASVPGLSSIGGGPGGLRLYGLAGFAPAMLTNARHLVAIAHAEGHMNLQFAVQVAFRDVPGTKASPPVIPTLREFGVLCRDIANVFK